VASAATLDQQGHRELLVSWVQPASLVTPDSQPCVVNRAFRVHQDLPERLARREQLGFRVHREKLGDQEELANLVFLD